MPETTYYKDEKVQITDIRAIFGSKTYSMSNVTSVSMYEMPAKRTTGIIIALVGLLISLCLFSISDSIGGGIFGILILIVGICLIFGAKEKYVVKIGIASGEVDGLVSHDSNYVQKIVEAMNQAIIQRG